MSHESYGIASALIAVLSTVLYVVAIWRGKIQPNRVTFWVWFVMGTIIYFSYGKSGGTTHWIQGVTTLTALVIALHSLHFGERTGEGVTRLQKRCLIVAALSIPLWALLRALFGDRPEAVFPVFFLNMLANGFGAGPTMEKLWNRPETEKSTSAWFLSFLSAVVNVPAVATWGPTDIVWNAWMVGFAAFAMYCLLLRRPASAVVSETS